MSEHTPTQIKGLPHNAYSELKPGEEYKPLMPPDQTPAEITPYSVIMGLIMAVLFSAAAAYLGLKIGQVFEAAIPIAIIAVGVSTLLKIKGSLGQNVIIQSIGQNSGLIVAGAIFTIPALYILNLEAHFYQIFLASAFGGVLGILFLIPFRKYFVAEMHGKFPFPEATATTEILVAGEKGGKQALVLVVSGLIGGIYDFIIATFGWWSEIFTTRVFGFGEMLADKFKLVFRLNIGAAVMGLGYIVGLKYAAIIAAGSFVSWYLLIPVISYIGAGLTEPFGTGATKLISAMSAEEIFRQYVRHVGIGGIAMAGIIGIIRSSKIIQSAFSLGFKEIFDKKGANNNKLRTQIDVSMKTILVGIVATAILLLVFFHFGVVDNIGWALAGLLIVLIISFLFTTVAANAIAIVGTNPVSGMTLMTLILSSIVLTSVGLKGESGMIAALIIGGVVCTALSMAGGFITDLKIGYWLGSTPRIWPIAKPCKTSSEVNRKRRGIPAVTVSPAGVQPPCSGMQRAALPPVRCPGFGTAMQPSAGRVAAGSAASGRSIRLSWEVPHATSRPSKPKETALQNRITGSAWITCCRGRTGRAPGPAGVRSAVRAAHSSPTSRTPACSVGVTPLS